MHKLLDITMALLSIIVLVLVLVLFFVTPPSSAPEIYIFVDVIMPEVKEATDDPPWEIEVLRPRVTPKAKIRNVRSY